MATFFYEAVNGEGHTVTGKVEAAGERAAHRSLKSRGLTPVTLEQAGGREALRGRARKAGPEERAMLLNELSVLIEAGVPIADAVKALQSSRTEPDLIAALDGIGRDLRHGVGLTVAFRNHMKAYPGYVVQLVEAGEQTGQLKDALTAACERMTYERQVQKEFRGALTYPAILVGSAVLAVLFVFLVVVPRFADMVKGRNANLPWLSDVVLSTGVAMREHMLLVFMGLGALAGVLVWAVRDQTVRDKVYAVAETLPVIGDWLIETEAARWTGMLAALLGHHVPILRALELSRGTVRSKRLKEQLGQVERSLRGGTMLSSALQEYTHLQSTVINLIRVGEKAGNLPAMLKSAAVMTDSAGRDRMKRVLALLEPAAVILIGLFIGTIVVAILTAITSVNEIPF